VYFVCLFRSLLNKEDDSSSTDNPGLPIGANIFSNETNDFSMQMTYCSGDGNVTPQFSGQKTGSWSDSFLGPSNQTSFLSGLQVAIGSTNFYSTIGQGLRKTFDPKAESFCPRIDWSFCKCLKMDRFVCFHVVLEGCELDVSGFDGECILGECESEERVVICKCESIQRSSNHRVFDRFLLTCVFFKRRFSSCLVQ
jgi:hypothetical protein